MSAGLVSLLIAAPFALVILGLPLSWWRGQRECDRLNAANDAAWETWKVLTPDDRTWLRSHGVTEPLPIHWEMR